MKTFLLSALLFIATSSSFAQGMVGFGNNAAQTITNCITGLPAAGSAAQDDTQVGLYVGNIGDAVSSLTLIGSTTNCFAPGRFNGGNRTLAGWTGTVQLQVRAWLATTVYASYEAALAGALGGDSSVLIGLSAPFNYTLTIAPAPVVSIGNAGLTPIIISPGLACVPEPSSYAIGLLALGALAMFRPKR